jgi:hypothetical protein
MIFTHNFVLSLIELVTRLMPGDRHIYHLAPKNIVKMLLANPVDILFAVSGQTSQISEPVPLILVCQAERHRRIRCVWLVRHFLAKL